MVIKNGQVVPGLQKYARRNRFVMAKRMKEKFMVESGNGWQQGRRGDWLVSLGDDLRIAVEENQFLRIFRSVSTDEPGCTGCDQADAR